MGGLWRGLFGVGWLFFSSSFPPFITVCSVIRVAGCRSLHGSGYELTKSIEADAPLSSTYHFTVNQGYDSFTCTVVNAPADPKTDWSNEACLESEVHVISWGYSTEGFAVMTVRDK